MYILRREKNLGSENWSPLSKRLQVRGNRVSRYVGSQQSCQDQQHSFKRQQSFVHVAPVYLIRDKIEENR